ncbi:DUF808 domain-containing protein [Shewanella aestuarii]|uniref:DUF808 domain-containing protein n=1 Tax=Shewanella aestuarii TaxID=1028752 RepID=A0A6G9QJZ8_9GAMM|nr:DUF808 domain-containing protein [Shewanella aestuarii]QIR14708.1 DUF808 domain-containing protein [Shewanella aestuarii]
MAGASLLTLLDDIATILDDVAAMSKVAARKTAGVLGDDLALNAQQVSGVASERELPVVWAVALGSFKNKLILVPLAMLISAFIPWAITPLLMFGGLFLCYEGFEKVYHSYQHPKAKQDPHLDDSEVEQKLQHDIDDLHTYEKQKVKGAIRTDFVLSAEIIAISLGVVAGSALMNQFLTLSVIAVVMTVGVYGLVAAIVKIDDVGLYLHQRQGEGMMTRIGRSIGLKLVTSAPYLMKGLTLVGTIAMFMVGGGILTHGIHAIAVWIESAALWTEQIAVVGGLLGLLTPSLLNALFGVVAGGCAVVVMSQVEKFKTNHVN